MNFRNHSFSTRQFRHIFGYYILVEPQEGEEEQEKNRKIKKILINLYAIVSSNTIL